MLNISDEMKIAHGRLSKTGLKFLEFIKQNPWCLKHSHYDSLQWPYRQLVFQPWPLFIDRSFQKEVSEAGISVYNLIKQIPKKIFDFDAGAMGRYFEIPKETIQYILHGVTERHIHQLLGRGDFINSPTQGFKCLEYNIAGNLGGWELPFWHTMYRQTLPLTSFFKENPLELINKNLMEVALRLYINRMVQEFSHLKKEINTVMVMANHQDGTTNSPLENYSAAMYRDILHSLDMDLEGELFVCDFNHLTVTGNYLYYKGKRVLCLHENYAGVVPEEILEIFRKGNLILYVGPLTFLMSNKFNIAVLSEHEESELFTAEERQNIRKYIPWTRKTVPGQTRYRGETVNLESFVAANKEKLVLKPALGYGGTDISIGLHAAPQEWQKAVEIAFKKKIWLVQEYIGPSRYLFQEGEEGYGERGIAWGIFVFGGSYAGSFLRSLPAVDKKGVINAKQGADVSVVFEVQE